MWNFTDNKFNNHYKNNTKNVELTQLSIFIQELLINA